MHILTRQVNEGVVIGEDIHVTVLEIREDHVRLGISSPRDIPTYWEQVVYVQAAERIEALQVH